LCDDIDATDYNDVANLFSVLAGNFENVVQYNRDNRAFEVLSLLLRASFLVPVVTFWYKWVFSVKKNNNFQLHCIQQEQLCCGNVLLFANMTLC